MMPALAVVLGCTDVPTAPAPAVDVNATAHAIDVGHVEHSLAAHSAPRTGSVMAVVALEDALARALPALEETGATQGLGEGLRQLLAQLQKGAGGSGDLDRALSEVLNAIERYQARAADEFQPDIGVVLLAVDAVAAADTDEGSPRTKDRSGS
jgi:hypothetical protein